MKTSIIIQNLKCGGCANTISNKLEELKGISNIDVDVNTSKVSFNYNSPEEELLVKNTLKKIGYPSIEDDNNIVTKAKSFVSCATGKLANN